MRTLRGCARDRWALTGGKPGRWQAPLRVFWGPYIAEGQSLGLTQLLSIPRPRRAHGRGPASPLPAYPLPQHFVLTP